MILIIVNWVTYMWVAEFTKLTNCVKQKKEGEINWKMMIHEETSLAYIRFIPEEEFDKNPRNCLRRKIQRGRLRLDERFRWV